MEKLLFKCIRSFQIPVVDGDGYFTDDYSSIAEGSVYEMQQPQGMMMVTDSDYRLNLIRGQGLGWIEISEERLTSYFKTVYEENING